MVEVVAGGDALNGNTGLTDGAYVIGIRAYNKDG
jgi:hypothetical protein